MRLPFFSDANPNADADEAIAHAIVERILERQPQSREMEMKMRKTAKELRSIT
jgi:hypothetical protein